MNTSQIYFNQPYEVFAQHMLDEAEELVEFYSGFIDDLGVEQTLAVQSYGVYPCQWSYRDENDLVQIGSRPGINLPLWERANRRWASQVLAAWEQKCRTKMPNRQFQVAWKESTGIDEWEDGKVILIAVFFDGEVDNTFHLGLPDDPTPLTDEERRALKTHLIQD